MPRSKLLVTWRVSMAELPSSSCLRRSSGGSHNILGPGLSQLKICKRRTREEDKNIKMREREREERKLYNQKPILLVL